jgi:hypothetical protein
MMGGEMEFTTKEEADAAWANEEASGNKSPEVHAASMRFYDRQYSGQTADLGNGSTVLQDLTSQAFPEQSYDQPPKLFATLLK